MNSSDELEIIESLIKEFHPEAVEIVYIADESDLMATHLERLRFLKATLTNRAERLQTKIESGKVEFMPDLKHVTEILRQIKPFELRHPEPV